MKGLKHYISMYFVFVTFFLQKNIIIAQNINFYPDQYGSTTQTLSLINPIYTGLTPFSEDKIGAKNNTGIFSDIRNIYAQGNFNISERETILHRIGADFISEQEGPIIRKNRMRLNYSIQKRIADNLSIGLGVHLGIASFDYNGSKSTSQGSSLGPDGSVALLMKYKNWSLGIHMNQIFDQAYRPKVTTFHYPIFYGYYLDKTWELKSGSKLKLFQLHHILTNRSNFYTIGLKFDYQEIGSLTLNYHHRRYITPTASINIGSLTNSLKALSLYFSYNSTIQLLRESKLNAFELGLDFRFK